MVISTRFSGSFFSLYSLKSHPKRIQRQIEALDLRMRELMKRVLFCQDVRSFAPVLADINRCLKQIESISEISQPFLRSNAGKWLFENIDVLFTNIYLVRHHASRLKEFTELGRDFDLLGHKIIQFNRRRESSPLAIEEITRKFKELDLCFFAIREGLAIRPLIDCQKECFDSLICRHRALKHYVKASTEIYGPTLNFQENISSSAQGGNSSWVFF